MKAQGTRVKRYSRRSPPMFRFRVGLERSTSMKKIFLLMAVIALVGLPASAQKDENNRIENAGKVMVEILNVPDDIPQDLLDKAECVIVLPSVMKAAFVVGGSYGRGVLTGRSRPDFNGRWSAPAMRQGHRSQ